MYMHLIVLKYFLSIKHIYKVRFCLHLKHDCSIKHINLTLETQKNKKIGKNC